MRDVTPKGNLELFLKCLGIAVGAVAIIALLKLAFSVFMSVAGWIIPIAIVLFIYKKFFDWLKTLKMGKIIINEQSF